MKAQTNSFSLNVLIAPDKFKGTLTARQAAEAIAEGWKRVRPADKLTLLPISDGGDGFGEVLSHVWDAKQKSVRTIDAAHRPLRARWWWEPKRKAAIIESAAVIGLAQLPPKRFHPFHLDTYGLGAVIRAASRQGARRCIIGIGGSATNDGGFGLAVALGWQFLDAAGRKIETWPHLNKLEHIVPPKRLAKAGARARTAESFPLDRAPLPNRESKRALPKGSPSPGAAGEASVKNRSNPGRGEGEPVKLFDEITVAVDVQNPLLGKNGATRIYGPQKGLRTRDFIKAEDSLRRLAHIAKRDLGLDLKDEPGTGAAGGLGFGLAAFLAARLEPGFHLFAREARLATKLRHTDLVITGEGRLDASTAMGKGVGELARLCRKLGIPCIGLAGEVVPTQKLKNFSQTAGITDLTDDRLAKKRPAFWLARLADAVARKDELRESHLL